MNTRNLGKLEQLVMEVLWERGHATVREVMADRRVDGRAYTTLMTTLSRLHDKGLLARTREGNAFRYQPRQDREQHGHDVAARLMRRLLRDEGEVALTAFVDAASDEDEAHLRRLSDLVERRLRERKEK